MMKNELKQKKGLKSKSGLSIYFDMILIDVYDVLWFLILPIFQMEALCQQLNQIRIHKQCQLQCQSDLATIVQSTTLLFVVCIFSIELRVMNMTST